MYKTLLIFIFIFSFIATMSAAYYTEPFVGNVDANFYNLTNIDWLFANNINGTLSGEVI